MTSQEERAREILAATAKVAEWIGFSGGAIKDGLGWTDEARKLHDEARAALAVLSEAPFSLAAEVREDAAKVAEGWCDPCLATDHENRSFANIAAAIRRGEG